MFVHTRCFVLTIASTVPRASILSSEHRHVDLSLKEFRTLSRRLAAIAVPYSHELQLLQRIFYKGKNQHRSSLFWRKVVEIRRFTTRVNELNLHGMLESFWILFHTSESSSNNPKLPKGAWTHTPDLNTCRMILKRLQSACFLVDRARVRLGVAYRALIVQLRTATFLPLIVSLVAITSRFDFLLSEVRSIITLQWEATVRVVKAIDCTSNLRYDRNVQLPCLPVMPQPSGKETAVNVTPNRRKPSDTTIEDLGHKVDRGIEPHLTVSASKSQSPVPRPFDRNPSPVLPDDQIMTSVVGHSNVSLGPSIPVVSTVGVTSLSSGSFTPLVPSTLISPNKDTQAHQKCEWLEGARSKKKAKTKAKKKWDEIDEIFGR